MSNDVKIVDSQTSMALDSIQANAKLLDQFINNDADHPVITPKGKTILSLEGIEAKATEYGYITKVVSFDTYVQMLNSSYPNFTAGRVWNDPNPLLNKLYQKDANGTWSHISYEDITDPQGRPIINLAGNVFGYNPSALPSEQNWIMNGTWALSSSNEIEVSSPDAEPFSMSKDVNDNEFLGMASGGIMRSACELIIDPLFEDQAQIDLGFLWGADPQGGSIINKGILFYIKRDGTDLKLVTPAGDEQTIANPGDTIKIESEFDGTTIILHYHADDNVGTMSYDISDIPTVTYGSNLFITKSDDTKATHFTLRKFEGYIANTDAIEITSYDSEHKAIVYNGTGMKIKCIVAPGVVRGELEFICADRGSTELTRSDNRVTFNGYASYMTNGSVAYRATLPGMPIDSENWILS